MEYDLNIYTISKTTHQLVIAANPKLKPKRRIIIGLGFALVFGTPLFFHDLPEKFFNLSLGISLLFLFAVALNVFAHFSKREIIFDKIQRKISCTTFFGLKKNETVFIGVKSMNTFSYRVKANRTGTGHVEFNGIEMEWQSGKKIILIPLEVTRKNKNKVYTESNELLRTIKEYLPVPMQYVETTTQM